MWFGEKFDRNSKVTITEHMCYQVFSKYMVKLIEHRTDIQQWEAKHQLDSCYTAKYSRLPNDNIIDTAML